MLPGNDLRQLLLHRSQWMEERLMERAEANGYGDITPAMSRLYAHLAGQRNGVALSELARRLTISRQAVHKIAREGELAGYVQLISDEQDRRIKLLRFTPKGRAMAASAARELQSIEQRLVTELGADAVNELKHLLSSPWSAQEGKAPAKP